MGGLRGREERKGNGEGRRHPPPLRAVTRRPLFPLAFAGCVFVLHHSLTAPGSYFSFMLGIGNVAVTTSVPPCVFTRAPVSQR